MSSAQQMVWPDNKQQSTAKRRVSTDPKKTAPSGGLRQGSDHVRKGHKPGRPLGKEDFHVAEDTFVPPRALKTPELKLARGMFFNVRAAGRNQPLSSALAISPCECLT